MRKKEREITDIGKIEEILRQGRTCQVAMVDEGLPYVVPLSYGYSFLADHTLEFYFHSAPVGRKMDVWAKNSLVCFSVFLEGEPIHTETPCHSGYYYSSVIGYGEVVILEDTAEKCRALSVMFKHQTGEDVVFDESHLTRVCVYKIVSRDYTGKIKPRLA
jgi:nitroimidazol reductase NimA-like FMN-containing flavoprotein (pyridoxamine 5'-phosphate oxidase superfamily)